METGDLILDSVYGSLIYLGQAIESTNIWGNYLYRHYVFGLKNGNMKIFSMSETVLLNCEIISSFEEDCE